MARRSLFWLARDFVVAGLADIFPSFTVRYVTENEVDYIIIELDVFSFLKFRLDTSDKAIVDAVGFFAESYGFRGEYWVGDFIYEHRSDDCKEKITRVEVEKVSDGIYEFRAGGNIVMTMKKGG